MPQLSVMRHTFKDELAAVATQVVNAGTPETTYYVYDGEGTRVRKVVEGAAAAGSTARQALRALHVRRHRARARVRAGGRGDARSGARCT